MTNTRSIESKFLKMGARASITQMTRQSYRQHLSPLAIDVPNGRWFDIVRARSVDLAVLDVQPRHRHLLLHAENAMGNDSFLCGHDEMHWFVAALPQGDDIRTVGDAMEALKPNIVKRREQPKGKRRRKGDVYIRQGEWFFIPWPHAKIDADGVLGNAKLVRGPGNKPHFCEFMYQDGEREYECNRYPKLAFFESEYLEILKTRRKSKQWNWRQLPFQPDIYVKGWITHTDHNPLFLDVWHRVEQNTERQELSVAQKPSRVRVVYRD